MKFAKTHELGRVPFLEKPEKCKVTKTKELSLRTPSVDLPRVGPRIVGRVVSECEFDSTSSTHTTFISGYG